MYSPIVNKVSNDGGLGMYSEFMDKISTLTWTNPPWINNGASIIKGFWFEPIQKSFSVLSPEIETAEEGIIFALKESSGEYPLKDKIVSLVLGSKISTKYSIFETILSWSWLMVVISNPISDSFPDNTSGVVCTLTLKKLSLKNWISLSTVPNPCACTDCIVPITKINKNANTKNFILCIYDDTK